MSSDEFLLKVVDFLASDGHNDLYFAKDKDGEIKVWVNLSDIFFWACGDAEELTEENWDRYLQAHEDTKDMARKYWADILFGARERKERPQNALFTVRLQEDGTEGRAKVIERQKAEMLEIFPLFAACGPYRPPDFGNPHDLSDELKAIDPDPAAREPREEKCDE